MSLFDDISDVLYERNYFDADKAAMVAYAIVIAEIYNAAPSVDGGIKSSYKATVANIDKLHDAIEKKMGIEIIPSEDDPYGSDEEMIVDIKRNSRIKVYTGHSEHPYYSPEQNVKFRAVHDIFAHYIPHKRNVGKDDKVKFKGFDFSFPGELDAYYMHKKYSPSACHPAYFCEIIGQVSYQAVTGEFGEQKLIDFSPYAEMNKIGKLKGKAKQRFDEIAAAVKAGQDIQSPLKVSFEQVMNNKAFAGKGKF